jgi:hypothetical protein
MIRTYSELRRLNTIEDRFKYLALHGQVGDITFGFDRYLNQDFYRSTEWRNIRHHVIARDNGCDLGVEGYDINDRIYVHHMTPMNVEDLIDGDEQILNPEFLISVTHRTHNAIHYGDVKLLPKKLVERRPGDTKLW